MSTSNFPWSTYPLPSGTVTDYGTISRISSTAYLIKERWVPFHVIHGPRPWAQRLARLG